MDSATVVSLLFLAEAVILAAYWQEIARFANRAHAVGPGREREAWLEYANHYDAWFRRIAAIAAVTVVLMLVILFGSPEAQHLVRWVLGGLWLAVLGFCVRYLAGLYKTDYRAKDLERMGIATDTKPNEEDS